MVRLLKPMQYYQERYGSWQWGLNKLYLLMEKQHNRGQDGAGIACVCIETPPGVEYLFRERAEGSGAIGEIFGNVSRHIVHGQQEGMSTEELPFYGSLLMGHLRYSTTGKHGLQYLHPFMRRDMYRARSLAVCGNFNLTNTEEVSNSIARKGQYPRSNADMHILLEQIGHRLDRQVEHLYEQLKAEGRERLELTRAIEDRVSMPDVFAQCAKTWDGGYVICSITGSGEMMALRDPWGIRPAFYFQNDEVVVVASERPVIQTAMNVCVDDVHELLPGQCINVTNDSKVHLQQLLPAVEPSSRCSFERIYFSRGSDKDIYQERKKLGYNLVPDVIKACNGDLKHMVVSFIPNTAEVAYFGMMHGLNDELNDIKAGKIALLAQQGSLATESLRNVLNMRIRSEKVAIKDIKLRTFIASGTLRNDMSSHVYDITYGTVETGVDNLVMIDDSIVRGTTLRDSIIKILSRLAPKRLIFVSSSPQVRYPDFYGIDMQNMQEFIAFKAAITLLEERGMENVITDTYQRCKSTLPLPKEECHENYVKAIYAPFTTEEISAKISLLVGNGTVPVTCLFQSLEGLHAACPGHRGDWYFSGNYPTPGGIKAVNKAFVDYYEKRGDRQTTPNKKINIS